LRECAVIIDSLDALSCFVHDVAIILREFAEVLLIRLGRLVIEMERLNVVTQLLQLIDLRRVDRYRLLRQRVIDDLA